MFDSDSDDADYLPAVLNRPKVANHLVHEKFTVDTRDHEDHTFCGVMFDVVCHCEDGASGFPLDFLQIDAVSVRGDLGPLTVWSTPDSFQRKEHSKELWTLCYEKEHGPSPQEYAQLELIKPITLKPGESCGLYVHSKLPGDDAIVYDNQRAAITYQDRGIKVMPGLAHLSNKPFGRHGMWGFPWRERREFVGQISYGVGYMLWNPVADVHRRFPDDFQRVVHLLLLCARRPESPLHCLQDEVVFYILNMCKFDWFRPQAQSAASSSSGSRTRVAPSSRFPAPWSLNRFTAPYRPRHEAPSQPSSDDDDDEDFDDSDVGVTDSDD